MRSSLRELFVAVLCLSSMLVVFDSQAFGQRRGGNSASNAPSNSSGGNVDGGATIEYKGSYPVPPVGVSGMILFLDPGGTIDSTVPYWEESHIINGSANPVLFYQTLEIRDSGGNLVDSYSVLVPVPPNTGVRTWTVSKTITLADGQYTLNGELGHYDANGNDVQLDTASESFIVSEPSS